MKLSVSQTLYVYPKTGVEDLMEEMDLEENIAVVTMGKKAKVIQHLTNDLSLVREAIGTPITYSVLST